MKNTKPCGIGLAALVFLLLGSSRDAAGGPPTGPIGDPGPGIRALAQRPLAESHRRQRHPAPAPESALAGGTLTLRGEIDGDWEYVEGHVVFTYDVSALAPGFGNLQMVARSYLATRVAGTNGYTVTWDRAAYWLDFDGDGPDVPRLLPAFELESSYVPEAVDDPYPEFADNPVVTQSCTSNQPCTIQLSQSVLLREPDVDYSEYPDEAATADLLFVANHLGQAIAAVLDVFDENEELVETKDLVEGDELQLSMIGYRISEPAFFYTVVVGEFAVLEEGLRIELENYIPGVDFQDPDLPADLNAGQRQMRLLIDAYRAEGGGTFAYGGPFNLGFNWANALNFLHRDSFEALRPAPGALVAKRR
jgi:hypothetical protein